MKKIVLILILLFPITLFAKSIKVTLNSCVDGDTAKFNYKDNVITARFLAIDTPEYTKEKERFGYEASTFTCESLENAKTIKLEYDSESDEKDKYDRDLVWVFVDDVLLQKELIKKGYANIDYIYGDYKYLTELEIEEEIAKSNKLGVWSEEKDLSLKEQIEAYIKNLELKDYIIIGVILVVIVVCITTGKKIPKSKLKKLYKEINK